MQSASRSVSSHPRPVLSVSGHLKMLWPGISVCAILALEVSSLSFAAGIGDACHVVRLLGLRWQVVSGGSCQHASVYHTCMQVSHMGCPQADIRLSMAVTCFWLLRVATSQTTPARSAQPAPFLSERHLTSVSLATLGPQAPWAAQATRPAIPSRPARKGHVSIWLWHPAVCMQFG